MNHKLKALALTALLLFSATLQAQDCVIPISVNLDESFSNIDAASVRILENQLRRAATNSGLNASAATSQFFITAKVDILDKEITSTAPAQVVQNIGVTLYVADQYNQKTFVSDYVELKGVGKTEQKSFNFALRQLNAQNSKISSFISKGKKKILEYYDSQSANILKEAKRAASLQNYDEAVALCASIPACCKAGDEATLQGAEIYAHNRDLLNQKLLLNAQSAWAAGQDSEAAQEAAYYLSTVDPESSSYTDAQNLLKEIRTQMRKDKDFKMRETYWAENKLEASRIEAWRAVGVAVGQGPKTTQTNLMWLGH